MDLQRYFEPTNIDIGPIVEAQNVSSSLAPFRKASSQVRYPGVVVSALGQLYAEYCNVLQLPKGAQEAATDFQHCDVPAFAVQIDMVGLPQGLLDELSSMSVEAVREVLRGLLFEVESSIAMYQLLERLFATHGRESAFSAGWRHVLSDLRKRYGDRPIALLAVTHEKHDALLMTEFSVQPGTKLSNEIVRELTGFDALLGPDEFRDMVKENGGDCPYLLFVRASDPVSKLRKPDEVIEQPLLGDAELRRIIRAHAVTLNVDNPMAPPELWVNDTKAYMPDMGLGFAVQAWEDLESESFKDFLRYRGISPESVYSGGVMLRAKPMVAAYGGYGHVRGFYLDKKFRSGVRSGLRKRGGYIMQPELPVPMVYDSLQNVEAGHIDRLFFGWADGAPYPIAGVRNYMPVGSGELEGGRIHGNGEAFWGEIHLR